MLEQLLSALLERFLGEYVQPHSLSPQEVTANLWKGACCFWGGGLRLNERAALRSVDG